MRVPRILASILMALLMMVQGIPVSAVITPSVISVDGNMNFGTPTGSGPYTYENVLTKNGITVDAIVTIIGQANATLGTVDDGASFPQRFNPTIATSANGYVHFRFEFVDNATGDPVLLKDFYLTALDLDGTASVQEFAEISGFESYSLDQTTELTPGPGADGRTNFTGMDDTQSGLAFTNETALIANYTAPISSMDVVLGNTGALSPARQFSVNFGLPGGTFTTPAHTFNSEAPSITVQIDDGGDGLLTPEDDLAAITISGETDTDSGQPVTLAITGSDNNTTYLATTADGTGYSVTADLSALPDGEITVVASTLSVAGNPASDEDTSTKETGTNTAVSCEPSETNVNQPVTCTATVTDEQPTEGINPEGTVTWSDDGSGTFTPSSCELVDGSCEVTYTPDQPSEGIDITADYDGGAIRGASSDTNSVIVQDGVALSAHDGEVYVNGTEQFSATGASGSYTFAVDIDNSDGAAVNGTGLYTAGLNGDVTDTVKVTDLNGTEATATVAVNKRPTATEVTCNPATLVVDGSTTCTASVTDTSGEATAVAVAGTVTFNSSEAGSFGSAGVCTLSNGTCSVSYTPTGDGTHTVSADYSGTVSHGVSDSSDPDGSNQSLTVNAALTIDPTEVEVPVYGVHPFTASGGVGTRTFDLVEDESAANGSVGGSTGDYTGGDQAGTTVTVRVQDTAGNTDEGTVMLVRRTTTAAVTCEPDETDEDASVTCTATIADTSNGTMQPLTEANVAFESDSSGTFGAVVCTGTSTLTCTVTYTPTGDGGSDHTVTVQYAQSAVHAASDGTAALTVYAELTLSAPTGAIYVRGSKQFTAAGGDETYTFAVQADESSGAAVNIAGLYTAGLTGGVTDTVKVTDGRGTEATATVTVNKRPTSIAVTCTPGTLVIDGSTTCTATVSDTSGEATPVAVQGTVTFSSTETGTFGTNSQCTLTNGACSVTYTPDTDGTHTLSAAYAGSNSHLASNSSDPGGSNQSLTVAKRGSSISLVCDPDPTTLGVATTCTVTATDTSDPMHVPSGSVTWTSNGTGTFGAESCTLDANGQCTVIYAPTVAGGGVHTITVALEGSATRDGATGSDSLTVQAGSLAGTVKTDVQDPVAGITLFLVDGNGQTRGSVITSETGAYSFTELYGGNYTVKVWSETAPLAQESVTVPAGSAATLDILLPSTATLTLTADPAKIVGDGKKISTLTAMLTAGGGAVGDVDVLFHATDGTLLEADTKTGLDGSAGAKLRAPLIAGVVEIVKEASVKVHDVQRGLFAFAKIDITFAPTSVDGIVMDNGDPRRPIAGATVRIRKSFEDSSTFEGEAVTDSEGRYSIIVPKGNTTYQVEITAEVEVGGFKKEITTTQTATLGDLSGIGEAIPATKTVSGQLFAPDKQGGITGIDVTLISGQQVVGFLRRTPDGTVLPNPVVIAANGAFQVGDVPIGSYEVVFQVQVQGQPPLAGAVVPVTVDSNGELTLGAALVDPFGIVTDARTGLPIGGVRVDLRWADTPLNVDKGRTPNQRVDLPPLPDFEPNQNRVYQNTTDDGEYAFMVFPDGDYYIVAIKSGYHAHESPVIHVGETIVEYNFEMRKRSSSGPSGPSDSPDPAEPPTPTPAVVKVRGTLVETQLGRPISGARVAIREDFDGDGVLDVDVAVHTAADGSYELGVPERNRTYTAEVTTTLPVDGKARQLTATQRIFVPADTDTNDTVTARNTVAGQLYFVALGGGEAIALTPAQAGALRASLQTADGTPINTPVTISDTGYYQVDDLAAGTYRILFESEDTDGGLVPIAQVAVPINNNGQLSLQATVIDPFATVRDGESNAPIPNAVASLFWADTALNRGNGRTPGTLVSLPAIAAFVSHDNANPYLSNASGRYGWLGLPHGDYYLVAKKDGYLPYDSRNDTRELTLGSGTLLQNGILHVEMIGRSYDIVLQPMKIDLLDRHSRYVQGYPDGNFLPENPVTRAEVAAIFARLMKVDLSGVTPAVMTDLEETHWASRHIAVVMKAGLFSGYPDGSFGPNKLITRAELATVIARFKELPLGNRGVFQDTAGHWAEPYITATFEAGIVLGFTDNTFGPTLTTRRSELVAMVNRMLGRGQLMTGRTQPRWPDVPFSHWAVRHIEEASTSHTSLLGEGQSEVLVEEFADTIE